MTFSEEDVRLILACAYEQRFLPYPCTSCNGFLNHRDGCPGK